MTRKSKKATKPKKPIHRLDQKTMTETEVQDFWQTHQVGKGLLASALEPDLKAKLQAARAERKSRNITLNLNEGLEQRIRHLAELEGVGYQTLIKQFVLERTYQEELRRGIVK
jgi:predicted DNA binding CopG/RHH family protein